MKLKVLGLSIFTLSFAGIFFLPHGSPLFIAAVIGIICTVWIDFYAVYQEHVNLEKELAAVSVEPIAGAA